MIVSTLSCSLLLRDDFTGNPIPGSDAMFHNRGSLVNPVRRRDGCYLFLDQDGHMLDLKVTLPRYLEQQIRIDTTVLSRQNPMLVTRMFRACSGGYEDCNWIDGTGPPQNLILAVAEPDAQIHFRQDQKNDGGQDGTLLSVSGYTARRLEGLRYVAEEAGREPRDFLLDEKLSGDSYRTTGLDDWGGDCSIPLRRAFLSRSDEQGNYRIPIAPGSHIKSIYVREGGQWVFLSAAAHS